MFEIHPVKKVSVVIPVYNEQESLPELIRRTTAACESLGKEYEILLIDDDPELRQLLAESSETATAAPAGSARPKRMTTLEKIKKIEEVIEREIKPNLKKDGGDIELVDVDGDIVTVSLRGACANCYSSRTTLKEYVEKKLREQVLDTLIVEEDRS